MQTIKHNILRMMFFISLSLFGMTAVAVSPEDITVKNMTAEEAMDKFAEMKAERAANGGGTADGLTPAVEDICTKWGFQGKINGLCNAYCEAMDCDTATPQASPQACTRVYDKIIGALGDAPFPSCNDEDNDGIPSGVDNCPQTFNQGQEDADGDGIGDDCDNCPTTSNSDQLDGNGNGIGDVCEEVTVACPCSGQTILGVLWGSSGGNGGSYWDYGYEAEAYLRDETGYDSGVYAADWGGECFISAPGQYKSGGYLPPAEAKACFNELKGKIDNLL